MEIGGLFMAILGQLGHPRAAPAGLAVRLGAPNADGGLSLALTF